MFPTTLRPCATNTLGAFHQPPRTGKSDQSRVCSSRESRTKHRVVGSGVLFFGWGKMWWVTGSNSVCSFFLCATIYRLAETIFKQAGTVSKPQIQICEVWDPGFASLCHLLSGWKMHIGTAPRVREVLPECVGPWAKRAYGLLQPAPPW